MSEQSRSFRINVTVSPALKRFLELKGELTGESVAGTAREILSNAMLGELDAVTKAHKLQPNDTNPTD